MADISSDIQPRLLALSSNKAFVAFPGSPKEIGSPGRGAPGIAVGAVEVGLGLPQRLPRDAVVHAILQGDQNTGARRLHSTMNVEVSTNPQLRDPAGDRAHPLHVHKHTLGQRNVVSPEAPVGHIHIHGVEPHGFKQNRKLRQNTLSSVNLADQPILPLHHAKLVPPHVETSVRDREQAVVVQSSNQLEQFTLRDNLRHNNIKSGGGLRGENVHVHRSLHLKRLELPCLVAHLSFDVDGKRILHSFSRLDRAESRVGNAQEEGGFRPLPRSRQVLENRLGRSHVRIRQEHLHR